MDRFEYNRRADRDAQSKGWKKQGKNHYRKDDGREIKYNVQSRRWVIYDREGKAKFNCGALWIAVKWEEKADL